MIMLGLILVVVTLGQVKSAPGQGCGTAQPPFDVIQDAAVHYCTCNFPTQQFNASCLLSSCPSLKGVCPLTSNGTVNQTALTSAVSILNTCIGQKGLVCGFNMSRNPIVPLGWTTAQLIPSTVAKGTIVHNPGTGYVQNLSNAKFTLQPNGNGPITLVIQEMDFYSEGYYNCTFHITPTSILRSLTGLIPDFNFLDTPNAKCVLRVNVTSTVTFDLTTPTPNTTTLDQQFDLNIFYSNFTNSKNVSLPQDLVDPINRVTNELLQDSVVPSAINNFLSNYAALGLRAAQLNCP